MPQYQTRDECVAVRMPLAVNLDKRDKRSAFVLRFKKDFFKLRQKGSRRMALARLARNACLVIAVAQGGAIHDQLGSGGRRPIPIPKAPPAVATNETIP